MRRVIDDFLPRSYFNEIKQMIENPEFCWNFSSILPEGWDGQTEKDWYFVKRICAQKSTLRRCAWILANDQTDVLFFEEKLNSSQNISSA